MRHIWLFYQLFKKFAKYLYQVTIKPEQDIAGETIEADRR